MVLLQLWLTKTANRMSFGVHYELWRCRSFGGSRVILRLRANKTDLAWHFHVAFICCSFLRRSNSPCILAPQNSIWQQKSHSFFFPPCSFQMTKELWRSLAIFCWTRADDPRENTTEQDWPTARHKKNKHTSAFPVRKFIVMFQVDQRWCLPTFCLTVVAYRHCTHVKEVPFLPSFLWP